MEYRVDLTLTGHCETVSALCDLGGGRLASVSMNEIIKLWNTETGQCDLTLTGSCRRVTALCVLRDGRLVSGSDDEIIKIWNTGTGQCVQTLIGHRGATWPFRRTQRA
mmetsp:Transcript_30954/g.42341  ORF Transcript_30954/g.42341 Transcript_30954/m.42341 type:complete len:108 (+) Transcript_30954:790-1113(+)